MNMRKGISRLGHTARIATALVAAAVGALVVAAPGHGAVSGLTGSFNHVQATCFYGGRIEVTSPTMSPSFDFAFGPNREFIVDPPQWVAFRVHVKRWSGIAWVLYSSGPWKAAQVTEASNNIADTWLNLRTNRWESGMTPFAIYARGFYQVYAEYYWYPQYGYPSGHIEPVATPFHAQGGYMGWGEPWCQF
jgi:hypothetical protein